MGFMVMDSKLCLMDFNLQGISKNVKPTIKQVSIFNQAKNLKIRDWEWDGHWKEKRWVVVWNPYLGQIRWIQPMKRFHQADMYALGYDNNNNNRNHKILRLLDVFKCSYILLFFEIYEFYSNVWRVLDVNPGCHVKPGASLKGNTYFFAQEKLTAQGSQFVLLCFDFTSERFRQRLILPFNSSVGSSKIVTLSCVRDEQLAVLHQRKDYIMEIWIMTKIEPNSASRSKFLRMKLNPTNFMAESFFIEEEKKGTIVSFRINKPPYQRAYIIGVNGCGRPVNSGKARKLGSDYYNQLVFSSTTPLPYKIALCRTTRAKEINDFPSDLPEKYLSDFKSIKEDKLDKNVFIGDISISNAFNSTKILFDPDVKIMKDFREKLPKNNQMIVHAEQSYSTSWGGAIDYH
ncbi:F-box protein At1g66490 [Eutrema salsugineum]|uniref:F-box protein At1g66490 n=1 Tax=Eutrema salsugineum TaxID=72664 RepID=UPI000CECEE33|nr:F-box protein At1g66490 [Eutrema salsugineum]